MQEDSNRDQEALVGALVEKIAEAAQDSQGGMFLSRAHAPSGFELESNIEDFLNWQEKRSSVAGGQQDKQDNGSDDEYVKSSEYEMDVDMDDLINLAASGLNEQFASPEA